MAFDPGQMRERVAFWRRVATDDGYGNTLSEFDPSTVIQRFALYLMRPGTEAVITARLAGLQPVDVVVRRDAQTRTITADWRMEDLATGLIYAIVGPPADLDRSRQWLTIPCVTGKAS